MDLNHVSSHVRPQKLGKFSSQDTQIQLLVTNQQSTRAPGVHAIALGDLDLKGLLECQNAHGMHQARQEKTRFRIVNDSL
jgi:hypothetical protein